MYHIVTFTAAAGVLLYCALFITQSTITRSYAEDLNTVVVRDALGQRVHRLSGMIMVPTACHELHTRAHAIDDENYKLDFITWKNPNLVCNSESVPRRFDITVFAPSTGVAFQATLDDVEIPIQVIATVE